MKVLILGLGVIGTTYGYAFKSAGHEVKHLIKNKIKNPKDIEISILDGRNVKSGIKYTKNYEVIYAEEGEIFDFILISVASGKIKEAINYVKSQKVKGTIILFCNFWSSRQEIDEIIKPFPYIIGFPTAGGSFNDNKLNCVIFDNIVLEKQSKTNIPNYQDILELFNSSDIKIEQPNDMVEWIWLHMAINAAVSVNAINLGVSNSSSEMAINLMNNSKALADVIITVRDTIKIVEARGVYLKNYRNELLPYKIPSRIGGIFMKRMFKKNELTRQIMILHNNINDITYGLLSVYNCSQDLKVNVPFFHKKTETALNLLDSKGISVNK